MKWLTKKWGRRIIFFGLTMMLLSSALVIFSHYVVEHAAREKCYRSLDSIPYRKVGLVLGTKKNIGPWPNLFFSYRMEAAAALFHAGKVSHLLVSGDNSRKDYDEAGDMREALIALGVPDSCITLDYAGFRTLDSVVRCKAVFGTASVTIISQEFHNERALFIAHEKGIDAIAFCAQDVPEQFSRHTRLREWGARVAAVLDVYVLGTTPKFLGESVAIR